MGLGDCECGGVSEAPSEAGEASTYSREPCGVRIWGGGRGCRVAENLPFLGRQQDLRMRILCLDGPPTINTGLFTHGLPWGQDLWHGVLCPG